jgi:hypothetical protein
VALVDPSYQVIRTFMNFRILEKVNEKTCAVYQKMLVESSIGSRGTPLHVAGDEGNENIFCFLYSALATKIENFESNKSEIEDYLLKVPNYNYSAFVYYFRNCNDTFNILFQVQTDFGFEFLKRIFLIEMYQNEKLLHAICRSDSENISKILTFLKNTFPHDLKFLKNVLAADKHGRSFLHVAFQYSKNETLMILLKELGALKKLLGQDFMNELVLMRSSNHGGVFLSLFVQSEHFSNDHFVKFLNQIKLLCDQETLRKFFFVVDDVSQTLLHKFCDHAKDFDLLQVLGWVAQVIGKESVSQIILLEDNWDKTIFHYFTERPNQSSSGLSILKFLKYSLKFDNKFLFAEVLLKINKEGHSVIYYIFKNAQKLPILEFLIEELNLTDPSFRDYLIEIISCTNEKSIRNKIISSLEMKVGKSFVFDFVYSSEILHGICEKYLIDMTVNYLNFLAEIIDFNFLKDCVSGKNSKKQTILFYFRRNMSSDLIKMLYWLKTTFKTDDNFLEKFLLQVDENLDSFLNFALKEYKDGLINVFFTKTYEFLLRNFDKVFVKKLLLLENNEGENFLNIICEKQNDEHVTNILDTLFKDFQNDRDFFTKLINEKSKKNQKVKDFVKFKLNNDFPEERNRKIEEMEISEEVEDSRCSCCKIC